VLRFDPPPSSTADEIELRLVSDQPTPGDWLFLGALAERIRVAAWSEDLRVQIVTSPGPPPSLRVTARDLW
jgi:hypothetical protein